MNNTDSSARQIEKPLRRGSVGALLPMCNPWLGSRLHALIPIRHKLSLRIGHYLGKNVDPRVEFQIVLDIGP
jgi:hypothetical protein